jgi:hypothetical protein
MAPSGVMWLSRAKIERSQPMQALSDRSAAGCWLGSTDIWTSIFQILLYSVQYSFRRILLLLLLKFHNGIYVTGSAPERV